MGPGAGPWVPEEDEGDDTDDGREPPATGHFSNEDEPDTGCGCMAGGATGGGALVLLSGLLAGARRRRRQ